MPNLFYAVLLLAVAAPRVIELRLVQIAQGGAAAQAEMISMVGEKWLQLLIRQLLDDRWHTGGRHRDTGNSSRKTLAA